MLDSEFLYRFEPIYEMKSIYIYKFWIQACDQVFWLEMFRDTCRPLQAPLHHISAYEMHTWTLFLWFVSIPKRRGITHVIISYLKITFLRLKNYIDNIPVCPQEINLEPANGNASILTQMQKVCYRQQSA